MGDVSSLFPEGIKHLDDLPHTIHTAIIMGLGFLSFDELPRDERPPKKIWFMPDEMKSWWSFVERKRKEEAGGDGHTSGGDMTKNKATEGLLV